MPVEKWTPDRRMERTRAALPEGVQDLSERFEVPVEKRGRLLIIEDAWVAAVKGALTGQRRR